MTRNLALIIPALGPGGAERALTELANYLATQHYSITLITLSDQQHAPFYSLHPAITLLQTGLETKTPHPIKRIKKIITRLITLRTTFKALAPDLIISFIDLMNLTTLLTTRCLNIPIIVSERIDPAFHPLPKFYRALRRLMYPKAACLVVQTKSAATYFTRYTKPKICLIPNVINKPHTLKTHVHPVTQLISIGRLVTQKDHATLIRAFAKLTRIHPKLSLTIYGEGNLKSHLQQLAQSLHLDNQIQFKEATPRPIDSLIQADLFIFPSLYEGFPNALGEAMAVGLPVIASDCTGNNALVDDQINGRLFPVGDVNALAHIIHELIADTPARIKLAQQARKICTRYTAKEIYARWESVIHAQIL